MIEMLNKFCRICLVVLSGASIVAASGCKDETASGTGSAAVERAPISPEAAELLAQWPPVRVNPLRLDFGEVMLNQPVTKNIELVNHGDVDVRLLDSRTNCGCTTADVTGLVVPANGTLDLPIHFDAEGRVGTRSATVTLFFVGWDRPLHFRISAYVVEE